MTIWIIPWCRRKQKTGSVLFDFRSEGFFPHKYGGRWNTGYLMEWRPRLSIVLDIIFWVILNSCLGNSDMQSVVNFIVSLSFYWIFILWNTCTISCKYHMYVRFPLFLNKIITYKKEQNNYNSNLSECLLLLKLDWGVERFVLDIRPASFCSPSHGWGMLHKANVWAPSHGWGMLQHHLKFEFLILLTLFYTLLFGCVRTRASDQQFH